MGEFKLKNPMFITSVGNGGDGYPDPAMAEIAMVGRSNVGKSSLINSGLLGHPSTQVKQG